MIIEPIVNGVVARSAHPIGCQQAVLNQIETVEHSSQITNGPKKVLVLGASSGFGLASRISLAFGGAQAIPSVSRLNVVQAIKEWVLRVGTTIFISAKKLKSVA